ncbi:MAG: hydrogenase maturation protease [Anaerolineales bacterium]
MFEWPQEERSSGWGVGEPAPCRSADTLIMAIGDPLRADDGAGAAVLEGLRKSRGLPMAVHLLDAGTGGLDITLTLGETSRAIIVDAADLGLRPGTWTRLCGDALRRFGQRAGNSTHSAGLAEALAIGEALGLLPKELVVYAIQPGDLSFREGLTSPVARAIPQVTSAILAEVCRGPVG